MSQTEKDLLSNVKILDDIASRKDQAWPALTEKWQVENPTPPWKTSLDGMCDALDDSACTNPGVAPTFKERRDEEDKLTHERYGHLPYPESQLVSLAHSLVSRGIIDEDKLAEKIQEIRNRLET